MLDATEGKRGLILVNVAPRGGHTTKWENGTPFGYFWYKETLVVSSVDGFALSAVKKLSLADNINLLDTHTAADTMLDQKFISEVAAKQVPTTQFRSFDFTPRAGAFLMLGNSLPTTDYSMEEVAVLPPAIWNIDCFGNCKTTLTLSEIDPEAKIENRFGTLPFTTRLRDVEDNESSLVQGSSGINDTRFLEMMTQRGHFAKLHNAKIGDDVFEDKSYFTSATK